MKPANVFLDMDKNVKLGDFGLARVLQHDTSFANTFVGTPYYMSPVRTVKPVLSGHSKIDKTQILMTNGSLMKVKSIAECSLWSIVQYF